MEPLHSIPVHNHTSVLLPPPFPSPPHPHHTNSNNTTPSSKPALGHTPIVVETRLKKTPISFTAHFVGLSGYIAADPNATIASPIIEAQDLSWTVHLSLNNSPYLGCGIYLESPNTTVRATYRLSLVNQMGWKNHFVSSEAVKTVTSTSGRALLCHEAKFISRDELKNAASGHCVDDTIMVMVELCIFSQEEKRILQAPPKPIGLTTVVDDETLKGSRHDHNGSLYDDMQALLFNRNFADVTIVIPSTSSSCAATSWDPHYEAVDPHGTSSSESIPAHSFVLALRSPVFRAMFQSNMLEAVSHQIVLNDCAEETVRDFISFLYTDRCPSLQHHERQIPVPLSAPSTASHMVQHLHSDLADTSDAGGGGCSEEATTDRVEQLLMLACKYDVRRLQALCEQDLVERMNADNVASLLRLADTFGAARLKASALKFIATNATAVIGQASFFEHLSKELSCEVIRTMAGMRL